MVYRRRYRGGRRWGGRRSYRRSWTSRYGTPELKKLYNGDFQAGAPGNWHSVGTTWATASVSQQIINGTICTQRVGSKVAIKKIMIYFPWQGGQNQSLTDDFYNKCRGMLWQATGPTDAPSFLALQDHSTPVMRGLNDQGLKRMIQQKKWLIKAREASSTYGYLSNTRMIMFKKTFKRPLILWYTGTNGEAKYPLYFSLITDSSGVPNPGIPDALATDYMKLAIWFYDH